MDKRASYLLLTLLIAVSLCFFLISADPDPEAHFIAGYVQNAPDCTSPNGMVVVAYPTGDPNDNVTDIIGPSGNSGASNEFLIDCQLLQNSCNVNEIITVEVPYQIDHSSGPVNVTITPAGFDTVNMTLERHYRVDIPTPCE